MKSSLYINIDDPEVRNGLVAGSGAVLGFVLQRFFKNRDSHSARLAKLEKQQQITDFRIQSMLHNIDRISKKLEEVHFNLENKDGYVHQKFHDLTNLINQKTLKDATVDSIDDKIDSVIKYLKINEKK